MPNDDESKKDDLGSTGSASNQEAEQKSPVYLFPENSVYDLAPIVVPQDMRLSPDAFESVDEPSAETVGEPASELDAERAAETGAEPAAESVVETGAETVFEPTAESVVEYGAETGAEPVPETGAATVAETFDSTESLQPAKAVSPPGLPPTGSRLKSKIQVQKVKATQEQAKIAQDTILQKRIEQSKSAQSRIEEARAGLSSASDLDSAANASNNQSADSGPKNQVEDGGDKDPRNLFPENSVFEMDPVVVVAEDQKLMPTRKPTYDPTRASQKLSPIKIDKFKPGAQRQASEARQAAVSQPKENFSPPPHPVPRPAEPKSNLNWLGVETESANVAEHGPGESDAVAADVTIAAPSTVNLGAQPVDSTPADPAEQIDVGDSSLKQIQVEFGSGADADVWLDAAAVAKPDLSLDAESVSKRAALSTGLDTASASGTDAALRQEAYSVNADIAATSEPSAPKSAQDDSWEESTGWEEINSRQDRWSEETGWEDAAGKSSWERGGWADQSGEQTAHANLQPSDSLQSQTQFAPSDDKVPEAVEDEHTVNVSETAFSINGETEANNFSPKTVGNLFSDDDDKFPEEVETNLELATTSGALAEEEETADWLKPKPVPGTAPAATHGAITGEQEIAEHGFITGEQQIPERGFITGEQQIPERGFITGEHAAGDYTAIDQPMPGFTTGKHSVPTPAYQEDAAAEAYITGEQQIDPMGFVTGEQPQQNEQLLHFGSQTFESRIPNESQNLELAQPESHPLEEPEKFELKQNDSPQILPWGTATVEAASHETSVSGLADAILQTGNERAPSIESASLSESILEEVEGAQSNFAPTEPEPFDVNKIGIATADIEQILFEHNSIQLTEGHSEKLTPDSDEYKYDDEDVLQDFRATDSIYELAPFVLPATSERLTDEDQDQAPAKTQPTVQQIVRHAETPERPAVPTYSTDPLVGTVLAHSYEILDVIGQGGMAIVYRAKQIATGRLVAIKTLRSPNPQDVLRFSQEIKTHSQLDHKNIVGYIDSFTARDQMFLVMERVRGISLQEIIRALGKLDEPENIVDILSQILDALNYAHAGGLIHRDLKTGNIILIKEVDNDMVVKILDFGIAKVQGDSQRLTHVGQALGSPIYMSPEQCSGKQLSTRSDLYSLGVLLYESVTGTPPYSKGTLINVMAAHCNENIKPKPLAEMDVKLPKTKMLDQILQKALQTHPDKRWQSAIEFKTALQFWLQCIQNDLAVEELPVELLRCPVSELDVDKLLSIAKGSASSPVPFQWAKEPAEAADTHAERWGQKSEGAAKSGEKPQVPPGWGGSERHRQGQTGDAWRGSAAAAAAAQSGSRNAANLTSTQSNQQHQAETSDIWNAKQQERRPVRDLLASPANPTPNFEVQTSVEMNALGSELPKLSSNETQEIRAITKTGALPQRTGGMSEIPGTENDTAEAQPAPIDLRRRQQQVTPAPPASNWMSIAAIVVVSVVLTLCLSILYVVSNPADVQAKMQAIQKLLNKKTDAQPKIKNTPTRDAKRSQENCSSSTTSTNNSSTDIDLKKESTNGDENPQERQPGQGAKPTNPGEFKKAEPEEGVDF